ncbi:glycosyltransferase [Candidatus Binatia bacterium]|nr:glycosyltransferase [Candidatus Binatia bacterium]
MQPIRVAHVIPDLSTGGAETALVRLLEGLDRTRFASLVITLRDGGALVARAERAGAHVASLGMRTRLPSPLTLWRLRAALRAFAPDVVQGWMYHGNLAAWAAVRLLQPRPALAWNIRQSLASLRHESALTRLVIRVGARLSSGADAVVNNSRASAAQHAALGFDPRRVEIVPNGFDTRLFRPDPEARGALRARLGVAPGAALAGLIARFDPVKRHDLFLEAVARVRRSGCDVHAIVAGPGATRENTALGRLVERAGLTAHAHLLGTCDGVERVLAALDVLVSASSRAEGFPNVVGEAMACGVPCVVTDTGDCAAIVGDAGVVVPPGDGTALAAALEEVLRLSPAERQALGDAGRRRAAERYTLAATSERYATLYAALVAPRASART